MTANSDRLKIYNFDQRGVLLDLEQAYADWSPLELGVPMIPFMATSTTPDVEPREGEVLVYDMVADRWNVRPIAEFMAPATAPAAPAAPAPAAEAEPVLPTLPVVEPTTIDQRVALMFARSQVLLESVAMGLGYRSMDTAISYLGDENPKFAAEAQALKLWRSRVETTAITITGEVLQGKREEPESLEAFEALLPSYADVAAELAGA